MDMKWRIMETIRLIEQYLDGTLGGEERNALEERAESDSDFCELIIMHKEVNESIRNNDLFEFRELVSRVSKDYFSAAVAERQTQKKKSLRVSYRFISRIAALFIFTAAAGFILRFTVFSRMSAARLYQKNYTAYHADVICRSAPVANMPLDEVIMSYNQGKYQDALRVLNEIIAKDRNNYLALFYKGLTCMETGDHVNAILSFKEIPVNWVSPFAEHRDWYLALALLKINNASEASAILQQISSGGGYYAGRAKQILKKLRP
jgi:tetratricopeptide (TPR) repeat protein